jgi:spore maturation protein SpmA
MLNGIFAGLILVSISYAALVGRMGDVSSALFDSARAAVDLVIGLVGAMVFLLGLMRIAFEGGLRQAVARALAPVLRRLFPEVPADHPAMSAMVMNLSSNLLGLGNAATPFGLKAMVELDRLNRYPGSATDAMVLLLAINTSLVALMPPLGTIAVRVAAGSERPEAIWLPTLLATTCSTVAAVGAHFALRKRPRFHHRPVAGGRAEATPLPEAQSETPSRERPPGRGAGLVVLATIGVLALGLVLEVRRLAAAHAAAETFQQIVQDWLLPVLIATLVLIGVRGGVAIYEAMIRGAREGLEVAARIVPYLVAILVAVGMLRASGALDFAISLLAPLVRPFGVPPEVLPMALLRPLSGSGSFAVMSETLQAYGPDSFVGLLTSTLQGSSETTFYVLALYLGAAGIRDGRHALAAGLIGDFAGFAAAVAACHWFFADAT